MYIALLVCYAYQVTKYYKLRGLGFISHSSESQSLWDQGVTGCFLLRTVRESFPCLSLATSSLLKIFGISWFHLSSHSILLSMFVSKFLFNRDIGILYWIRGPPFTMTSSELVMSTASLSLKRSHSEILDVRLPHKNHRKTKFNY